MDAIINGLFTRQDELVTRAQALQYLTEDELRAKLGKTWRVALPGIYASSTNDLSARQRLRAAVLHGGPTAMLSDTSALLGYQLPFIPTDDVARVLVADNVQRASREFVVVRRTTRLPRPVIVAGLPLAPARRALSEFILRHPDQRESLAVAAAAVQLGRVALAELVEEAMLGPARGRPRLLRVIATLQAGIRSAPEADFREIVLRSRGLSEPLWNCLLLLPDGRKISPDALWIDSGVVHEVNGRRYHSAALAGEDAFEDMQRRSDLRVTAGLTVLHNSPNRIRTDGAAVIREIITCVKRNNGKGLPSGVVILRAGPPGTPQQCDIAGVGRLVRYANAPAM
jgi:hypothetical protein